MSGKIYCLAAQLGILALATGCQSTALVSYQPRYAAGYFTLNKTPVTIADVSDSRSTEPAVYYKNSNNGDTGRFDRPVADLVREAITYELRKAGHPVSNNGPGSVTLICEIRDFEATMSEPPFQSSVLNKSVVLRFEWTDAATGRVLANDERSEHRSHNLGFGNTVKLPFDSSIVRGYGDEMVNDMLPRIIEKEIEVSPFLHGASATVPATIPKPPRP